jgi:hypothetical protein
MEYPVEIKNYLEIEVLFKDFFDKSGVSKICYGCHFLAEPGNHRCCSSDMYSIDKVSGEAGKIFREAQQDVLPLSSGKACPVLSSEGCSLEKFRGVICLTYLCDFTIDYLNQTFGIVYSPWQIGSKLLKILNKNDENAFLEAKKIVGDWVQIVKEKII